MPKVIRFAGLLLAAELACGPVAADEKAPNTLTPKEVANGWLMLFDGETTFGWKISGEVTVKDGKLIVGGTMPTKLATTTNFADVQFHISYRTPDGKPITGGMLRLPNTVNDLKGATTGIFSGSLLTQSWQTAPVLIEVPANQVIEFDSIQVRPIKGLPVPHQLGPLFNGKDLSGWKMFNDPKRSKSKFVVTPAGELRVTNGPGDLQTEGKYADFVLQLECKTNGKNLNSGIFFRCVPDQYQNGYEAQIHNGYKDDDRTKPSDFGTGAIYRRVPARKVVANDNEWFTMTVVANGPHVATWVNGYQTVDWTDERKPADNPRQGLRTAAGHVSIQGHDPTTDILFRNIRIAELKEKE